MSDSHDTETKPCVMCDRQLESAVPSDMAYQPYQGGVIRFTFGYGSTRFDKCCGTTEFYGIICDECAAKYAAKMFEWHTEPAFGTINRSGDSEDLEAQESTNDEPERNLG